MGKSNSCPNCGAARVAGYEFCTNCGTKYPASIDPPVNKMYCPNGCKITDYSSGFCPNCNAILTEKEPIVFCPNGHRNKAGNRFCTTCRAELPFLPVEKDEESAPISEKKEMRKPSSLPDVPDVMKPLTNNDMKKEKK